jgi:hypothetical protein
MPAKKKTIDKTEDAHMEEVKTEETKSVPIKSVPKASKPKEIKKEVTVVALKDVEKTNFNGVIYPGIKEGHQAKLPINFANYLAMIKDIDGHKIITIVK